MRNDWIAYFSMEIGIDARMPTYSGGLGVLAGDTMLSAADLGIPMVGFTLLHRKGYFRQRFDATGFQHEEPVEWDVSSLLREMTPRVSVSMDGRAVQIRAWKYDVAGVTGHIVPVYFLDTDLPENTDFDRPLTDHLYGGDDHYRLRQEIVLGIGGVRMARALGCEPISRFHMNEGHAALLALELLAERAHRDGRSAVTPEDIAAVREQCVFTTHTPVPAGHDEFPLEMVRRTLNCSESAPVGEPVSGAVGLVGRMLKEPETLRQLEAVFHGDHLLNMTYLALNLSEYVNGVAKKHGEVSRNMFTGFKIDAITNGVHAGRWTAPAFQQLYDRYIDGWRKDNFALRHAVGIPKREVWNAHVDCKSSLIDFVNGRTNVKMDTERLTIGFARRAAPYKRADLLFSDVERLRHISETSGPLQVVYAGKAHPRNHEGKELIRRIVRAMESLKPHVTAVYLEDYDMEMGGLITAGVDVWLNTPQPPLEASGTSGMKAALNGVPSFSVRDGWWIEGHIEGVTGWSIGKGDDRSLDAHSLYEKLEHLLIPLYYREPDRFIDIMRNAIAFNGSFFNSQRMLQQYVVSAYL